jgi:hypothetical protein
VVPEHLEETALFGFFFILAAAFEIAWAMAVLFRTAVIVYTIGALANSATIGIWLLSRTIGLPIGPEPWMPEPMQSLDVAATSMELLLVVGCGALLSRHMHAKVRGERILMNALARLCPSGRSWRRQPRVGGVKFW